jgi:hypothetical protein
MPTITPDSESLAANVFLCGVCECVCECVCVSVCVGIEKRGEEGRGERREDEMK